MTHLLGAQDCVDSLRTDLIDLQGTLVDVFSRTGPVSFRSWKFPDKESCDLDLVQLLEQYDYVEGEEEFNQRSHIVLLELVIDRLLLLLHSVNAYTELMLGGQRAGDYGKAGGSVCLGLVVKHYWSNLIHFSREKRQQRISSASSHRHAEPRKCSSTPPGSTLLSSPSYSLYASPMASVRCRSVSCQTAESALVPCDACAGVQATLQDSAHAVASLCRALGLSCSLWGFLQAVDETLQLGRLSACDLSLWAREQQRDLGRVQKHVTHVQEEVESLTHTLQKAEEEREELRAQLEREKEMSKREREERKREREERKRREEEWERRLQEETHRRDQELKTQQEAREELTRGAADLKVKISELRREVELQAETQQRLEREKDSLVDEVHRLRLEQMRWKETEEKKRNLETELRDTQKLLDKENAKYRSTQRHHEAMAVKQRALLERVDVLVQQCEELQTRLEECEDEKAELVDTLTHTTQERDTLQEQLKQQKSECLSLNEDRQKQCVRLQELEQCVSRLTEDLQQAEERERILVAFPELNPQHTTPQSTGDVLCDMEQQFKVNSMRIRVLEQENASLTKTLARLKHTPPISPCHQSAGDHTPRPDSGCSDASLTKTLARLKHTPPIRPCNQSAGDHTPRPDSGCSDVGKRERGKEKQITSSPSSSSSSSSSALHIQMLRLSAIPDAQETYTKLRQAARARSAGKNRRRK